MKKFLENRKVFKGFKFREGKDGFILIKYTKSSDRVIIPQSVVEIGQQCFSECKSLSEVRFEEGSIIKRLEEKSFSESGLKIIHIPMTIELLGNECFMHSPLSEITFENGALLRKIGNDVFTKTKVENIRIPRSVEEIGSNCFSECYSLSEITFEEGSILRRIGDGAFTRTKVKTLRIPKTVEEIGRVCFSECYSLSEVTFEEGSILRRIGDEAFSGASLKNIRVPSSVEELGEKCFDSNRHTYIFLDVTFEEGSNLKMIREKRFSEARIDTFCIPSSVEKICNDAFKYSRLKGIAFEGPSSVKWIGEQAFTSTMLTTIQIPKSVQEIAKECFKQCEYLCEVTFEKGSDLRKIGEGAFSRSKLKSIHIPKSVEEIGKDCFRYCPNFSEFTVEMGSNLKRIAEAALYGTNLTQVCIPKSLEEIGAFCFCDCKSLSDLTFEKGSNLKMIRKYAFNKTGLKSLRIPKSVEEIEKRCFGSCKDLSDFTIEDGSKLRKLGEQVFHEYMPHSSSINTLIIPRSVEEIGYQCFMEFTYLKNLIFEAGSNLKKIEGWAFHLSRNYTSIVLPKDEKERIYNILFAPETKLDPSGVHIIEVDTEEPRVELDTSESTEDRNEPVTALSDLAIDITQWNRVRRLGHGGFGNVFLYSKKDMFIAAKFMEADEEGRMQESFEREIENLYSLSHSFIVGFRGFCLPSVTTGNNFVVAMEYISGGSLDKVINDPPSWLDNTTKAEIISGIALGMSFVHSKGIIHRDLKLSNVLLDNNHLPRICDFGSSRLFSTESTLTANPGVTLFYKAPEVYDGVYTMKMDVYSFGVILYELVTGKLAFRQFTEMQLVKRVGIMGYREPIPASVTPFTRDLIGSCWDADPDSRPSFETICSSLDENMELLFQECDLTRLKEFRSKYFRERL